MNYQNYDDYMRSLMGYPNMRASMNPSMNTNMMNTNMMNQNMMNPSMNMMNPNMMSPSMDMNVCTEDLERMYPEVYRVVHPMVCSACDNMRTPVTEEMVDMMTDDIYDRVEADGRINVEVSVEVRTDKPKGEEETRQRRPRRRNRFLRDLIRILLLRELIGRRRRFPFRPF